MGYDLLAAAFFVVLTPFVIVGFILFWSVNAKNHEALATTWRSYAESRGLEFVEPIGDWPNRTAASLVWSACGAKLRVSTRGREATLRTRLIVRPESALLGALTVVVGEGGPGRIEVRERPAGFSERVLTDVVKRMLLGFRQRDRVVFAYRRGCVILEWPGFERGNSRLDDARRIGEEVARAVAVEFARSPRPRTSAS